MNEAMAILEFINVLLLPIGIAVFRIHKKMTIIEDTHTRIRARCCLYTLNCPMKKD